MTSAPPQEASAPSATAFALSLPEIVGPIVDGFVGGRLRLRYLARLALVNRLFNHTTTPVLYRKLDYRLEWAVIHIADRTSLQALLATFANRPSLAGLVQAASVIFGSQQERQALELLQLLPNLRYLTLEARGDLIDSLPAALLAGLPHIRFVNVVLVQRRPAFLSEEYLQRILGKPTGSSPISLCVECLHPSQVDTYIPFIGDHISHLDLKVIELPGPTAHSLDSIWDAIFSSLPSLRTLRMSNRLAAQVPLERLGSLVELEHITLDLYHEALIDLMEMLADSAIWPKLRSSPYVLRETGRNSARLLNALLLDARFNAVDEDHREQECRRLIKAAQEGLRRRPFWSDSAVAPNPWA